MQIKLRTTSIITITVVLSLLLSFVFIINYPYFDKDYENVYAFKPSNADKIETSSISENTTYQFIKAGKPKMMQI